MNDSMGQILLIILASFGGLCGLLALMAVLEPAKPHLRLQEEQAAAGRRPDARHRRE